MKKELLAAAVSFVLLFTVSQAFAWTDHAQLTYIIFSDDSSLHDTVAAEPLESFIIKEKAGLALALKKEEAWLVRHISRYPHLPENLVFSESQPAETARSSFLRALRVNPSMPFSLFTQSAPGITHTRAKLPDSKAALIKIQIPNPPLEKLNPGEKLSALEVLATAADEPDFGMDINLYEDNNSSFGKEYGFGKQPWGNPAYDCGTQAPFHMGFFHENPVIGFAAPFTKQSLTEYRFNLYSTLSAFAFRTHHPYWGYRFAGWALHYLQDSAVIYHSKMLPNISVMSIITASLTGDGDKRAVFVNMISNKHYLYEDYAFYAVKDLIAKKKMNHPLLLALADRSHDAAIPSFTPFFIRDRSSAAAAKRCDEIDALITPVYPATFISDPAYVYGVTEPAIDLFAYVEKKDGQAAEQLNKSYETVFRDLGSYSRSFMQWVHTPDIKDTKRPVSMILLFIIIAAAALVIIVLGWILVRHTSMKKTIAATVRYVEKTKKIRAVKRRK